MSSPIDYGEIEAPIPPVFRRLLVNALVPGVTSSFLWFALTFCRVEIPATATVTAAIAAIWTTSCLGESTTG